MQPFTDSHNSLMSLGGWLGKGRLHHAEIRSVRHLLLTLSRMKVDYQLRLHFRACPALPNLWGFLARLLFPHHQFNRKANYAAC